VRASTLLVRASPQKRQRERRTEPLRAQLHWLARTTRTQLPGLKLPGLKLPGLKLSGLKELAQFADSRAMAEPIDQLQILKIAVETLERKIDALYRHLNVSYEESDLPSYMVEATSLVRSGRRDEAVKLIREYTATGILEARQMVEQIERNLGVQHAKEPVFR
jgi:ribosomal protein L7/L12